MKGNMLAMIPIIKLTRYVYDVDGYQTYDKVWQTGPESYRLEGHPANPKRGPYARDMTLEELRQWETEHPKGVTTQYDPVTHLPLTSL
jgi:hypothetical protein